MARCQLAEATIFSFRLFLSFVFVGDRQFLGADIEGTEGSISHRIELE